MEHIPVIDNIYVSFIINVPVQVRISVFNFLRSSLAVQSVARLIEEQVIPGSISGPATNFRGN